MAEKNKEIPTTEALENKAQVKKESEWKIKSCPVVRYIPQNGILGFMFENTPCQITVEKHLNIIGTIDIKYRGSIKDGIEFKL